jgi:two-component system phosphate regulon sensor histidine kinase PhoR
MLLLIVLGVWMLVATSLKQMELGRMKADFAANVSHELRTPLALIRGAADTLCGGRELGAADRARYLGIIGRESERLTELIDTVMKYTALERGPAATALMPADVCALVREFTAEQRRRLEEEGFVVRTAIPDAPLEARLDAEAMRLVLVNLFSNAVKFAGARKEITVTVTDRDAGLAIRVSDRGIGIAEGDKRRIFDVFYRAEGELVKKTRGTGIGLALARQIVHAHKGRISVESTLGEGATFTVWLPRVPPAQRPGPQAQDVPADGLGAR